MEVSIRTEQFCGLSMHHKWQEWLLSKHPALHKDLLSHLRSSRSCSENRAKMESILRHIVKVKNDREELVAFLKEHFPYVVEEKSRPAIAAAGDEIFPGHNPNVITFPRRAILTGANAELEAQVFCSKHAYCDYLVSGGKAYVEYLEDRDIHLKEAIPSKNWLLAGYRKRNGFQT